MRPLTLQRALQENSEASLFGISKRMKPPNGSFAVPALVFWFREGAPPPSSSWQTPGASPRRAVRPPGERLQAFCPCTNEFP